MRLAPRFLLVLAALSLGLPAAARADQYEHEFSLEGFHCLELREYPDDPPLFTLERIEYKVTGASGHLKLYVSSDPDALAACLAGGFLTAQVSTAESAQDVPLALFIECACAGSNILRGYGYISGRTCEDYCPDGADGQQFFLSVYVLFGPDTDLAIGWEPNQLWFFEQQF